MLGYLWQLMRPLLLFGVLYVLFTQVILSVSDDVRFYCVALLLGLVLFTFFSEATGGAVELDRRPREPRAQDRVPAPRRPDVGGAPPRCSTSG